MSMLTTMQMQKYKFETNRQLLVNFKDQGYKGPFSLRWTTNFLRNSLLLHQSREDMLAVPHKVKTQLQELIKRDVMFDGPNLDLLTTMQDSRRMMEARGIMLSMVALRQTLSAIHGKQSGLTEAGTRLAGGAPVNTEEELTTQSIIQQLDEKIYKILQNKEDDKQVNEYAGIILSNSDLPYTRPGKNGLAQPATLWRHLPHEIIDLAAKLVKENGTDNHVSSARLVNKRATMNERLSGEIWRTLNADGDGKTLKERKVIFQMPQELLEGRSCTALDTLSIEKLLDLCISNEGSGTVEWESGPGYTANFAAMVRGLSIMESQGDDALNLSAQGYSQQKREAHILDLWKKVQDAIVVKSNIPTGKNHLTYRTGLGVYQSLMTTPLLRDNMTTEVKGKMSEEWERLILGTHLNISHPLHFSGRFYEPIQTYPKEDPKTGKPINKPEFVIPEEFESIGERLKRYYCGGGRQAHNAMYLDQLQRSGVTDAQFAGYAWNYVTNSLRVVEYAREMGMGGDAPSSNPGLKKKLQGIVDTANEIGMSLQMGKLGIPEHNLGALAEAPNTVTPDLEFVTLMKSRPVIEDATEHNGEPLKAFPVSYLPQYLGLCDKRTVQKGAETRKGVQKLEAPRAWLENYLTSHDWENMKQMPLDTLNQLVGDDTLAKRGEESVPLDIHWRRPNLVSGGVKREIKRRQLMGQPLERLMH